MQHKYFVGGRSTSVVAGAVRYAVIFEGNANRKSPSAGSGAVALRRSRSTYDMVLFSLFFSFLMYGSRYFFGAIPQILYVCGLNCVICNTYCLLVRNLPK